MSVGLFTHQEKFVYSKAKFPALVSGYGAGKTFALCCKAVVEMGYNAGYTGLLMSPTYRMIKDTLQPTFEEVLKYAKFNYEYSATDNRYRCYWSDGLLMVFYGVLKTIVGWQDLTLRGQDLTKQHYSKMTNVGKWSYQDCEKETHSEPSSAQPLKDSTMSTTIGKKIRKQDMN